MEGPGMVMQDVPLDRCENCQGIDFSITDYKDMHSSQKVIHCTTCGYIYWEDSTVRSS